MDIERVGRIREGMVRKRVVSRDILDLRCQRWRAASRMARDKLYRDDNGIGEKWLKDSKEI